MKTETLTSLAMLRVQIDRGADYFDYLVPFVSHVIRSSSQKTFTPHIIQKALLKEFGIKMPQHTITKVARRIAKRTQAIALQDGVFKVLKEIRVTGFETDRAKARQRQAIVVTSLMNFAKVRFDLKWDENSCQSAILKFLHSFSIDCLKAYSAGTALPSIKSDDKSTDYVVSVFLQDSYRTSAEVFDSFLVILRGNMLANALLCEDLQSLEKKYDSVTFYLDTPFMMHVLGFWGDAAKKAADELLNLLLQLRAKLCVFNHTVIEIRNVIKHAAAELEKQSHSPHGMVRSLRRDGFRPVDLWTTEQELPDILKRHGVTSEPAPPYLDKYNIGETDLRGVIDKEMNYGNERAEANDVNSIRSIYALRKSNTPVRIEDAAAVLVTTNSALVRAAYKYSQKHENGLEVPAVMQDYTLANTAWLKAPLVAPDLPKFELMAHCYAAMSPPSETWERFSAEIDLLLMSGKITAEQHALLRHKANVSDDLMEVTLGIEERVTSDNIHDILSRAEKRLKAGYAEEVEVEKQITAKAIADKLRSEAVLSNQRSRILLLAGRIGLIVRYSVFSITTALIAASLFFGSAFGAYWLDKPSPLFFTVTLVTLVTVGMIFSFYTGMFGETPISLSRNCERIAGRLVAEKAARIFGVPLDEN
ncbi:MAG TPA: hypothetical protein VGD97_01480 [Lacunisphaera sp.]